MFDVRFCKNKHRDSIDRFYETLGKIIDYSKKKKRKTSIIDASENNAHPYLQEAHLHWIFWGTDISSER